jgi:pyruvate formate lyase activating enzyme
MEVKRITRRDFIKGLGGLGILALSGGAIISCAKREKTPPVKERFIIELSEGEGYIKLEGGSVRCLGCLNRCVIQEGGVGICKARQNMGGRLYDLEPPEDPSLREAMWYRRSGDKRAFCELCFRGCIIPEGQRGFCRVRENRGGRLYTLTYSRPCGLQIDPIELEPMYHMVPGHWNLCVFTPSCNFRCLHCQNWHISQRSPEELITRNISPEEVVEETINRGCKSISHSINEPIVFYEYMLDIVKRAKERGERKLLTLLHTNGSLSPEPLREVLKYMDGITVDLKGFTEEFYRMESSAELWPVLRTLEIVREEGVHLEIVNLVIPTLNDDPEDIRRMCIWIKEKLGADIPLHFTRFFPHYKLTHLPPTPIETLEKARGIALEAGLQYVYVGNVPGHKANNTFCPECGRVLIHRVHYVVMKNNVVDGECPFCGERIPGIWEK